MINHIGEIKDSVGKLYLTVSKLPFLMLMTIVDLKEMVSISMLWLSFLMPLLIENGLKIDKQQKRESGKPWLRISSANRC
jgi:hypothetical protein